MGSDNATPLDTLSAGADLDAMVAEFVMGEARPTHEHVHAHIQPIASPGGNWQCIPRYENGDVCECDLAPFSRPVYEGGISWQ
jgi:hypothetical protein